jgi:hypothetical protein
MHHTINLKLLQLGRKQPSAIQGYRSESLQQTASRQLRVGVVAVGFAT